MKDLPKRPSDFSDEEYAELCEIQSRAPDGVKANPEYIRVARGSIVGAFVNGLPIYDQTKPV